MRSDSLADVSHRLGGCVLYRTYGTPPRPDSCYLMQLFEQTEFDLDAIHEVLVENEVVEGPEELYLLVSELWPDLLHKVKPPIARMH
jgi:hypothetical protein